MPLTISLINVFSYSCFQSFLFISTCCCDLDSQSIIDDVIIAVT